MGVAVLEDDDKEDTEKDFDGVGDGVAVIEREAVTSVEGDIEEVTVDEKMRNKSHF